MPKPKKPAWLQTLLYAVFPRRCGLCNAVVSPQRALCAACAAGLPYIAAPRCERCAANEADCFCGGVPRAYAQLTAAFYYEGAVKQAVGLLKFHQREEKAVYLGQQMAKAVSRDYAYVPLDVVACVPISKKRIRERGYNQSGLLARQVAQELGLALDETLLHKLHDTPTQRNFTVAQRRANVLNSYSVRQNAALRGKRILLCDDVCTTGATLEECARVLAESGAAGVYCVTACVTKRQAPHK